MNTVIQAIIFIAGGTTVLHIVKTGPAEILDFCGYFLFREIVGCGILDRYTEAVPERGRKSARGAG